MNRPTPPPADDATTRADLAQALIPEAAYLAMAVRDRDPNEIATRLNGLTRHRLEALAVVLAAMVDPDRSLKEALAWVDFDEHGRPLQPEPCRDFRLIRNAAREPAQSAAIGPDYAAALRALEGEPITLRKLDRALAVELAARRGWTTPQIAAALDMTETAVDRAWQRVKDRARANGRPVPRRPIAPSRTEAAA